MKKKIKKLENAIKHVCAHFNLTCVYTLYYERHMKAKISPTNKTCNYKNACNL